MFKRIVTILLLVAFTAMSFSKNLIIMDFYANRSEIAAKYCVNKNRPMLHCNGHCFLMRALDKEAKQEKALGDNFNKYDNIVCAHNFPSLVVSTVWKQNKNSDWSIYKTPYRAQDYRTDLFRPPAIV